MELAPITGLFGTNSSGKTSILQSLLLLKQTVQSPDRTQPLFFGDETESLAYLGTFQDLLHGHDITASLDIRLQWTLPKRLSVKDPAVANTELFSDDKLGFETKVSIDNKRLGVKLVSYRFAGHEFQLQQKDSPSKYRLASKGGAFSFKRTRGRQWDLPAPVKCYGFPDQVRFYYKNADFLADLQLAFETLFRKTYYLGPLREYPQRQYTWAGADPADMGWRGERVVDALLAARQRNLTISRGRGRERMHLEAYVATWLKELGLIHSFSIERIAEGSNLYQVRVQKSPTSAKVLITDVGFGVSQILPVLVLCFYVPEGSTILLEQPEIHLHPAVQAGLADVFIDAIKKRNVQIIFESHSEHLLQRLQRRIAEGDIPSQQVRPYFCDVQNGQTQLVPLHLDLLGHIDNWPKDFFGDRFGEMAAMEDAALRRQGQGQ